MSGYVLTPAAQADLEDIWRYSVQQWSFAQAERYILAIRDACDDLAAGVQNGQDAGDIRAGYRKLKVGSHVLFFRRSGNTIDIVRILHQRMDLPNRL
ncbi:MAG: type II toxin-antitoxin system RelE/ParE family toxin [Brevundimonas sp.]|uniref:type II toxin-antitoxin system RelE/ParE family toxin n=1 Tax=Brevundimonas sp. TaxID=1871086 RepID=UPI002732C8DA|nr:type II toxin-antitoxin system RelE/ParE family toxin [Brevundimonas sp.]MDP3378093.1 type II toxin-antitoxin system RelE/ParE family toxin [Brevundimonas sp.]